MVEILALALLALSGAGALATALICARVLRSLVRLEAAVRALRLPAAISFSAMLAPEEMFIRRPSMGFW